MNNNRNSLNFRTLNLIWAFFLLSTITIPLVSVIILANQTYDPSLDSKFASYFVVSLGGLFLLISHYCFKFVTEKPIAFNKYFVSYLISLLCSEMASVLGLLHGLTSNLDFYSYVLFSLSFLSVVLKKPKTNLILLEKI